VEPDQRSRRDPQRAKELDYVHQRRSAAEYPHAWRRALPAKKARSQRAFRRGQAAALRTAHGQIDQGRVERAESLAHRTWRRRVRAWTNPTLRDAVTHSLQARVDRAGWNFFKDDYDGDRHRRPFVAFLTALTAARRGPHAAALAGRFDRILRAPVPGPATVTSGPRDVRRQRLWLAAFFAEEPGWQSRLHDWTVAVLATQVR
jgi:hypothetical protein